MMNHQIKYGAAGTAFDKAISFRCVWFFLIICLLPFKVNAFQPNNIEPIELSVSDQKKFEDMSCKKFVGTEINTIHAQTTKGLKHPTDVFIKCKPHNKLDGYLLMTSVGCHLWDDQWSCGYPSLVVLISLSGQKILIHSNPNEIYGALEAIKFLDKKGKFKEDNFLKSAMPENICSVSEFKNSKWSVQCNESWGYSLKRSCDGSKCDFEMTDEGIVFQ